MPQLSPKNAANPLHRRAKKSGAHSLAPKPRRKGGSPARADLGGSSLELLGQPSPPIADTCTTYNQMLF